MSKDRNEGLDRGSKQSITIIPIDKIAYNHHHYRHFIGASKLDALKESVKQKGVMQPVNVSIVDDKYVVTDGSRRLSASVSAGFDEIPAIINSGNFQDSRLESLIEALNENNKHEALNCIDRALALGELEKMGKSRAEIIELCNIKASSLSELIKISKIDPDVLSMCASFEFNKKNFLTELSKFNPGQMLYALQYFIAKKVLPPRDKRPKKPGKTGKNNTIPMRAIFDSIKNVLTNGVMTDQEKVCDIEVIVSKLSSLNREKFDA